MNPSINRRQHGNVEQLRALELQAMTTFILRLKRLGRSSEQIQSMTRVAFAQRVVQ
jgi:hypothetical protein